MSKPYCLLTRAALDTGLHHEWCQHVIATVQMAQAYDYTMSVAELTDTVQRLHLPLAGAEGHPAPCVPGQEQAIAEAILGALAMVRAA